MKSSSLTAIGETDDLANYAKRDTPQSHDTPFALMVILLPVLFMVNALIYSLGGDGYTRQIDDYNRRVTENRKHIIKYADQSLAELALVGPGEMPKRPSRLTFCAGGVDEVVSRSIQMKSEGTISRSSGVPDEDYKWRPPLKLEYEVESAGSTPTRRVKINWVFIGVLMSFFAILFTFDAIARRTDAWHAELDDVEYDLP